MGGDYIGDSPDDINNPGSMYGDQTDSRGSQDSLNPRELFKDYVKLERYKPWDFGGKERFPQRGIPVITKGLRKSNPR